MSALVENNEFQFGENPFGENPIGVLEPFLWLLQMNGYQTLR